MSRGMGGSGWLIILFAMLLTILMVPIRGDPETRLLAYGCSSVSNTNTTLFAQNLKKALAYVVDNILPNGYSTVSEQAAPDLVNSVYALAQCRKDKSAADCRECIKVAKEKVSNCTKVTGGKATYDGCFMRFENYNFSNSYTDEGNKQVCGSVANASSPTFSATAQSLMSDLCVATPKVKYYFAANSKKGPSNTTIYGLATCARNLQMDSCQKCLAIALNNINKCFPRSQGLAVDAGCYLRYASSPFYPLNATVDLGDYLPGGNKKSSTVWIIIGVVGGVFILALILSFILFRNKIIPPSQKQVDTEGATELRGPGDFDFKILKRATNNFDQANKLGQGGFGEVFKGTLKNGNIVAIKKLTLARSPRAISEFESEVKLISNVHHRNLVRLLGCCRQGHERLLVYEYMPNSSLDRILFGERKKGLSWKERFDIILGTARGLAYLHEEFHVCIIHRDIKSSNILLDENFQAKIADFGLARLLPHDKTHISTKFAGTLGYTAPEYAGNGQLTEKADTYSFGVVVLEIVSGRKSIDLNQPPDMQYLLEWAWSLHEENKILEMVEREEKMEGYNEEEVVRVIKLALQCIQASPTHRPSMSEVVTILLSKGETDFEKPLQPAFVDVGYKIRGESYSLTTQSDATVTESLTAR